MLTPPPHSEQPGPAARGCKPRQGWIMGPGFLSEPDFWPPWTVQTKNLWDAFLLDQIKVTFPPVFLVLFFSFLIFLRYVHPWSLEWCSLIKYSFHLQPAPFRTCCCSMKLDEWSDNFVDFRIIEKGHVQKHQPKTDPYWVPSSPTWPATVTYRPVGLTRAQRTRKKKVKRTDVMLMDINHHKSQNYQFRMFWTLWLVGILVVYICYMIFPYQLVTSDFRVTDGEIGWMVVWLVNYWIAPI